jgi:hypothetical protein
MTKEEILRQEEIEDNEVLNDEQRYALYYYAELCYYSCIKKGDAAHSTLFNLFLSRLNLSEEDILQLKAYHSSAKPEELYRAMRSIDDKELFDTFISMCVVFVDDSDTYFTEKKFGDMLQAIGLTIDDVRTIMKNRGLSSIKHYYERERTNAWNEVDGKDEAADSWIDESGAEYSADRKRLIHVPGEIKNYSVLDGTEVIGDYAFDNTEAEDVEYDEVVRSGNCIWDYIRSASELVSVTIPNSIKTIGKDIFVGCDKLAAIHIPEDSKEKFEQLLPEYKDLLIECISTCLSKDASKDSWTDEFGVTYSKDNKYLLFGGRLKEYNIQEGTQIICDHALEARFDSACLEKIRIPDTVKAIGYSAFFNCAFDDVYLPDSIEYIGVNAFENCFCLRKAVLPNSIKEIDNEAFRDCSNLKSVYLPSSLRIIGQNVFSGCNSLQNIYVVKGSKARFEKLLPELANKITELDVEVDKSFREMFKTLEKEGITMFFSRNDNEDHTTFNATVRKSKPTKTTDSQSRALLQEEEYYLKHYSQTKEEYFNCNYNEVMHLTATCRRNSSNFYRHEEYPELEVGKTYEVSHIGVLSSSSWIILKEFGDKEYNAACFEIFENGESIDRIYTQEKRFWAPYLREWLKKRK